MKLTGEFYQQQRDWNDASFPICCLVIGAIEWGMLLLYILSCLPQYPTFKVEYFWFFLSAGLIAAAAYLLDRRLRRNRDLISWIRIVTLSALLLWACLLTARELHAGNSPYVFAQMLVILSAGVRLQTSFHCALNTVAYIFFVLAVVHLAPNQEVLFSEIINNAILLFISWTIIIICNRMLYHGFYATQERVRTQRSQLVLMASQLEQAQQAQEHIMMIRHDLRHFAWQVRQGVERRDLEEIDAVVKKLFDQLEQTSSYTNLQSYTGVTSLDSILTRYVRRAQNNNIPVEVHMNAPEGMDPQDLSLILLNALENAAAAVEAQGPDERRFLRIWSGDIHGQYFLEILNTYPEGSVEFDSSGDLPVSRSPGHGYGIRSIVSVLEQYDAIYRFQADVGVFQFHFFLPEK
ncbi:GHKL domain-containing protein [Feifania hominis]|uniref:GHKL domain-containing protein n=1 Tax=Feifania hominis TaxID=2763660 RepID=A0A926DFP1_9FIRM|nr:GHKL domain-containing protein [Feifania hominis]MBC8536160.1 GHKL domain-containing protein [Feifania hominis]